MTFLWFVFYGRERERWLGGGHRRWVSKNGVMVVVNGVSDLGKKFGEREMCNELVCEWNIYARAKWSFALFQSNRVRSSE